MLSDNRIEELSQKFVDSNSKYQQAILQQLIVEGEPAKTAYNFYRFGNYLGSFWYESQLQELMRKPDSLETLGHSN